MPDGRMEPVAAEYIASKRPAALEGQLFGQPQPGEIADGEQGGCRRAKVQPMQRTHTKIKCAEIRIQKEQRRRARPPLRVEDGY
jgi:hypothetical protein